MDNKLLTEILHRENEIKEKLDNNNSLKDLLKHFSEKMDDILKNTNNTVRKIPSKKIYEKIDVYEKACNYVNEQFEEASFKDPIFFSSFGVEVQNELKMKKKSVILYLNECIDNLTKEMDFLVQNSLSKKEEKIQSKKFKVK
jgi:DNA-binding MltR family transcriptional regulator